MNKGLVLILLMISRLLKSECLSGCLKCNTRDECLFCDGTNNYILDGVTCKNINLINCTTINNAGNCLTCEKGHYLDKQTYKCVKIEESQLIQNCESYASSNECQVCKKDFVVEKSICKTIETPIEGCVISDSSDVKKCLECENNYVLTLDRKQCVLVTEYPNCGSYSLLECLNCKDNYIIDRNIYINQIFQFSNETDKYTVLKKLLWDSRSFFDQGTYRTCKKIEVTNCLEFKNYKECTKCKDKYFLTELNKCETFPEDRITNCKVYQNASTCLDCEEGFFLENAKTCTKIVPVNGCQTYSTKANKTICLQCQDTHYLDEKSNCVLRTDLSTFMTCKKRHLNLDRCIGCDTGFVLTSDNLACMAELANCIEYADSDKNTSEMVCKKCKAGYYYNNSLVKCDQGKIPNCEIYTTNDNICTKCINQYYLKSNECIKHVDMFGCLEYHVDTAKTCNDCDNKSYLFKRKNGCVEAVKTEENCEIFSNYNTCQVCKLDYSPNSNGVCERISTIANCRKLKASDKTKCEICKSSYFIQNGLCVAPQDYFNTNCSETNINGSLDYTQVLCNYCAKNSIPISYKDNYVCVSNYIPANKIIPSCLKYNHNVVNDTYTCAYCDNEYNVSTTGDSCVVNCVSNEAVLFIVGRKYSSAGQGAAIYNRVIIDGYRKCSAITGEQKDCLYLYPTLFSSTNTNNENWETGCGLCPSTAFSTVIADKIIIANDPTGAYFLGRSVLSAHAAVKCDIVPEDAVPFQRPLSNCQYYRYVDDATGNKYKCFKCNFGYHGVIVVDEILTCEEMVSCDTTSPWRDGVLLYKSEFKNLKTSYDAFFSCYKCKAINHIPFVAFDLSNAASMPIVKAYGIQAVMTASQAYSSFTGGRSVVCLDTTSHLSFGIELASNYNFPSNCALGIIAVNSNASAATSNSPSPTNNMTAIQCVACKPMFKAIRYVNISTTITRNGISECQPIGSTCSNSVWFNACSECRSGHTYKYDNTKKIIEFDNCVIFSDVNCFTAVQIDGIYECKYCNKGYSLNLDKVCEIINAPKCIVSNMNFSYNFDVSFDFDQFNVMMFLTPKGPGCHKCFGGYISLLSSSIFQEYICTESDYVGGGLYVSNSKMISNCANYSINNTTKVIICKVCDSGFYPSTNGKCIPESNSPNCIYFKDSMICQICREGFVVISGTCEKKKIDKCLVINEGELVEQQTCLKCEPNYYPSENMCLLGSIANCEELTGTKSCERCLAGFTKLVIADVTDYCYPISPILNCEILLQSQFSNGFVECTKCKPQFALSNNTIYYENTICMNFQHFENCVEYDIQKTIEQSSFKCKMCLISHFLDENKLCVERKNKVSNCIVYKTALDQCQECKEGYFVSDDGLTCVLYPFGIKGCEHYINKTECTKCKVDMYLENNVCNTVEKKIDKCLYYQAAKICEKCDVGYAVEDAGCIQAQATNCLEYEKKIACRSCPPGYGFKEENGIKNCVEKNVTKCVESENFFPFKCLVCAKDFYPDEGRCQEVVDTIKDCIIYKDSTKCKVCIQGTTLSFDEKECKEDLNILSILDPNCKESKITNPICTGCKKGFIMDEKGKCQSCSKSTIEEGCYNCDPNDQSKCIICAPNFYQTKESVCKKLSITPDKDKTPDNTDNQNQNPTKELAFLIHILLTGLLVLI